MPHNICSILLKGSFNQEIAQEYDLLGIPLGFELTPFPIDVNFTTYWQHKLNCQGTLETNCPQIPWFPNEMAIYELMKRITNRDLIQYGIILTDYFGGKGSQYANAFQNEKNLDTKLDTISKVLRQLGVQKGGFFDEFDALGLGELRSNPDYLEKYRDLCEDLGL